MLESAAHVVALHSNPRLIFHYSSSFRLLQLPVSQEEEKKADSRLPSHIQGKCQVFEDNIDTDAIIPAQFMPGKDDTDLGTHCFEFVAPEFRQKVADGYDIVVAGIGFGSGSSREEAVRALMGCGVKVRTAREPSSVYFAMLPSPLSASRTRLAFYLVV